MSGTLFIICANQHLSRNLIPALILGLAFFSLFYLIIPEYDTIKVLDQEIERRQLILDKRVTAIQKVDSLGREIKNREDEAKRLSNLMPPISQTDQVISGLDQIANQAGVGMVQVTTSAITSASNNYQNLSIGMQLFGEYSSFVNFISLLEQSLRLYDIENITVGKSQDSTSLGNLLNFNITMNAYFLKTADKNQ